MSQIDRRDFLKMTSALILGAHIPKIPLKVIEGASISSPDMIQGVAVYGLRDNIDSTEKFVQLQNTLNSDFEANVRNKRKLAFLSSSPDTDPKKRDLVWGKSVRALEVVVRRSDFQNDPLGGDFVQRMKIETDLMSRIFENADPPPQLSAKLARVIVVDDKFSDHPGFINYTNDVDHSEFIGGVEAGDKYTQRKGEFMETWLVSASPQGEAEIRWGQGLEVFDETYRLKEKQDSIQNLFDYQVSYFRIHELMHRLFNLPDEYVQNIRNVELPNFRFNNFEIGKGNFNVPRLSPFIAMLATWKKKEGIRGLFDNNRSANVSQQNMTDVLSMRPQFIKINISGASNVKIYPVVMNGGYYPAQGDKGRSLADSPAQQSSDGSFYLDSKLFTQTTWHEPHFIENETPIMDGREVKIVPTSYVIQANVNGTNKELNLPCSALVMSKLAGKSFFAKYDIQFYNMNDPGTNTLIAQVVNSTELKHIETDAMTNETIFPYARAQIDGTPYFIVWFQEKRKIISRTTEMPPVTPIPED